ncbi:MAG: ABC transporter ATP-binding protein [Anaerolineae bacterium]|nr:ABC transporter ATP-binding protein [Anaerolineae bacterium]
MATQTNHEVDIELRNVIKEFPGRGGEAGLRAVDNVSMSIYRGEFFAMLGPSGCGKTTTLRMIAGFEDPSSGEILLRGKPVQNVPPFHRPVNTVFQDYALFPHMTVLQNVMFGLQMKGVKKDEARDRSVQALEMVKLTGFDRKPRQMSGGQQQRVALARALVNQPEVLLLDEPLGALDLKLRKEMQYELASMQEQLGITFIYVTHDQEEAMTMADRIAVMDKGTVLQSGSPDDIYETPRTRFVADFIGETNFVVGKYVGMWERFAQVEISEGLVIEAGIDGDELQAGQEVTVAIRPEKMNLFAIEGLVKYPDGTSDQSADYKARLLKDPDIDMVEGKVIYVNYIGTDTRYIVEVGQGIQMVARVQNFGLRSETFYDIGQKVNVFWDAETARVLTR